jgi:Protein of unknown function (DUF3531)
VQLSVCDPANAALVCDGSRHRRHAFCRHHRRTSKPNWLRILEEDAAVDEDVAELLDGAGGDPEVVRSRMEARLRGGPGSHSGGPTGSSALFQARTGSDDPPRVSFRDMDVLDTWVWLELAAPPTERERELLASAIRSWFVVGKLGGYNSSNLQVHMRSAPHPVPSVAPRSRICVRRV